MKIFSNSENDTKSVAEKVVELLKKGKYSGAGILFLKGELGSGKTTLTKFIAKLLGSNEEIVSPTYLIIKEALTSDDLFKKIYHIDAYRLESFEEIINLGFNDIVKEENTLVVVEWPERIEGSNISPNLTVDITMEGEGRVFNLL